MYTPLNVDRQQTRLVQIQPSRYVEAQIECTLIITDLQAHPRPQFEALSHCWGDINTTVQIRLNGSEWSIPSSLSQALRRLRLDDAERVLWIDTLCINQADLIERASQVGLMHSIYRDAGKVVVWLEDCKPESQDLALLTLEYLGNGVRWMELFPNHEDEAGASNDTSKCVEGLSMDGEDFLEPPVGQLVDFLNLKWWERLWTLQEIVLAQNIEFQWGARTFSWSFLERAELNLRIEADSNIAEMVHLNHDMEYLVNLLTDRVSEIQLFKAQQKTIWDKQVNEEWLFLMFASALARCRYRSSMDYRDKVIGLLGLFPESVRLAIGPSYQDSVREIHLRAAYLILQKTKSFFSFNHATMDSDSRLDCPSWVPTWKSAMRYHEDDDFRIAQRLSFSACGSSPFSICMEREGALCISAIKVDKISITGDEVIYKDPGGFLNHMFDWESTVTRWNEEHANILGPNSNVRRSAILPVLLHNLPASGISFGSSQPDDSDLLDVEQWLDVTVIGPENNERLSRMTFTKAPNANILQHMISTVGGKALFITEMGYVGVMSGSNYPYPSTESPWELFVAAGGTHPIILSPTSGKPSTYEVISEAFVPRIMQGEIVDGKEAVADLPSWRQSRGKKAFRPPWESIKLV